MRKAVVTCKIKKTQTFAKNSVLFCRQKCLAVKVLYMQLCETFLDCGYM